MKLLLVVKDPQAWEEALFRALKEVKQRETYLLFIDEAVTRCVRCEPQLFKHLHQFVLDGGRAMIAQESLLQFGLSPERPPDFLERLSNSHDFIARFEGKVQTYPTR